MEREEQCQQEQEEKSGHQKEKWGETITTNTHTNKSFSKVVEPNLQVQVCALESNESTFCLEPAEVPGHNRFK